MEGNKEKNSTFLVKLLVGIVIFLMGVLCCFAYFKFSDTKIEREVDSSEEVNDSNKVSKDKASDNSQVDTNKEVKDDETTTDDTSSSVNETTKPLHTEEFINQNGETVKITAEKIVGATGYAGSSNDKFFLKDGNLYYMEITSAKKEVLLATSVKDLYLEQDEICAELNSDGKIVNQEIHVKYK